MIGIDLLTKPVSKQILALIMGAIQQSLEQIANNRYGWITYFGSTTAKSHTMRPADKVSA